MNTQLSRLWLTGVYDSRFYKNGGNQGNIALFARYNFDHDLNVNVNYSYFSGAIFLQGKSSNYVYTSVNAVKDFFNKKASFSLTIYDPLSKYSIYSTYTKTPDFLQSSYSQNYNQSIRLALSYKFGKLKSNINTNKRGIKNDDVKGNNNSSDN